MNENKFSYEVVFVNDGSTDKSWEVVEALQKRSENVLGIKVPVIITENRLPCIADSVLRKATW